MTLWKELRVAHVSRIREAGALGFAHPLARQGENAGVNRPSRTLEGRLVLSQNLTHCQS